MVHATVLEKLGNGKTALDEESQRSQAAIAAEMEGKMVEKLCERECWLVKPDGEGLEACEDKYQAVLNDKGDKKAADEQSLVRLRQNGPTSLGS